jgi:hypothetical protein
MLPAHFRRFRFDQRQRHHCILAAIAQAAVILLTLLRPYLEVMAALKLGGGTDDAEKSGKE